MLHFFIIGLRSILKMHPFPFFSEAVTEKKNHIFIEFDRFSMKIMDFHYYQQQLYHPLVCNDNNNILDPMKMSHRSNMNQGILSQRLFPENNSNIQENVSTTKTITKKTKSKTIEVNIENIDDLLKIIEKYEYYDDTEYNIDLEALKKIHEEFKIPDTYQIIGMITAGVEDSNTDISKNKHNKKKLIHNEFFSR